MTAAIATARASVPLSAASPRRDPEEERQGVHELAGDLSRPGRALVAHQLVGPVRRQAARGLARRETLGPGPQIPEEPLDRLERILLVGSLGRLVRHRLRMVAASP
jgi:hypothetical protein